MPCATYWFDIKVRITYHHTLFRCIVCCHRLCVRQTVRGTGSVKVFCSVIYVNGVTNVIVTGNGYNGISILRLVRHHRTFHVRFFSPFFSVSFVIFTGFWRNSPQSDTLNHTIPVLVSDQVFKCGVEIFILSGGGCRIESV